jgi:hypothetical protein
MDSSQFDQLVRSLTALRTRRTAITTLGVALGLPALTTLGASAKKKKKKRKKPCAKTCKKGCCTGKKGKCIKPNKQDSSRCGTGGEICRSTGCAGTCPKCKCSATAPCPTGQCCAGDGTCGPCLVFVTSTQQSGNLGGLKGADDVCEVLAEDAGLPGTYMAWLSDTTGSPASRFTRATVPYVRVDGLSVADDWDDLTDGRLKRPINVTEQGQVLGPPTSNNWVRSNTTNSGERQTGRNDCENWINGSSGTLFGNTGDAQSINAAWTNSGFQGCNTSVRLYCFQQS